MRLEERERGGGKKQRCGVVVMGEAGGGGEARLYGRERRKEGGAGRLFIYVPGERARAGGVSCPTFSPVARRGWVDD
jgi:hypothetical protein